jgi:hypothetical protein
LPHFALAFVGIPQDVGVKLHEAAALFDCLLLGVGLDDGVAADQLFGFGERAVGDGHLSSADMDARAF